MKAVLDLEQDIFIRLEGCGAQIDDEPEGFDSTLRHVESGLRFVHSPKVFLFPSIHCAVSVVLISLFETHKIGTLNFEFELNVSPLI